MKVTYLFTMNGEAFHIAAVIKVFLQCSHKFIIPWWTTQQKCSEITNKKVCFD